MKWWCEIMSSCYIPSRTTQTEWDEYDAADPPASVEKEQVPYGCQTPQSTLGWDLLTHDFLHNPFQSSEPGFWRREKQETETLIKPVPVGKQKHVCLFFLFVFCGVLHYESAVSWGFPHR